MQSSNAISCKRNVLALVFFIGLTAGNVGSNTDSEVHTISVLSNTDGSLDIDGNGELDALTDGLLLLRVMFGLSGDQLIQGAIGDNSVYTRSDDVEARVNLLGDNLDMIKMGAWMLLAMV